MDIITDPLHESHHITLRDLELDLLRVNEELQIMKERLIAERKE